MQIKISEKNTKIGQIPNLSLPPGKSCLPSFPCYNDGCYAKRSYERWPNVENAWDSNLKLYKEQPGIFFGDLNVFLGERKPERFRLFVGGDFPDFAFVCVVNEIFRLHKNTSVLAFTKRYDFFDSPEILDLPPNFKVVLSVWPGLDLPPTRKLPWAWLKEDPRRPANHEMYECPGGCKDCGHMCWDKIKPGLDVVFPRH